MADFSLFPASHNFGLDRGKAIDRYYIENFLERYKALIKGNVLEIGYNRYTLKYGQGVTRSDVLNVTPTPKATIIGNLATGENIPLSQFDCIILSQVIPFIYDVKAALHNTLQALKPGGALLLTTSGITKNTFESNIIK